MPNLFMVTNLITGQPQAYVPGIVFSLGNVPLMLALPVDPELTLVQLDVIWMDGCPLREMKEEGFQQMMVEMLLQDGWDFYQYPNPCIFIGQRAAEDQHSTLLGGAVYPYSIN